MQWLAAICVRRPVFTWVLMLSLVVIGLSSIRGLGVDRFPNIDFPVVIVTTQLPGASPEQIESEVTDKLEESINTIGGLDELRSNSFEGLSVVVARFDLDKNSAVAAQEVRDRVNRTIALLPREITQPRVEQIDPDAAPVMLIALSGPRSLRELTEYASRRIRRRIESLNGVGGVSVLGGRARQINVELDPSRLQSFGLTAADVQRALATQNVEVPGGAVNAGVRRFTVRVQGRVETVEEMNDLAISTRGGLTVHLRDVGAATDSEADPSSLATLNDREVVMLAVRKQSGTNTVAVIDALRERVAEVQGTLPAGFRLQPVRDESEFIRNAIHAVEEHLILGSLFAALVVLLFLWNGRSTLIAALAIPTSIIATFALIKAMGLSLNVITLLGLTLSVGIVIDDAIVVLENIIRFIEEKGMSPRKAAVLATKEIGLAVLATTLSLVAVFLPVAFMGGIIGRFMASFGFTMSFAIMISLIVSFTLTPMLSSRWLKPSGKARPLHALHDDPSEDPDSDWVDPPPPQSDPVRRGVFRLFFNALDFFGFGSRKAEAGSYKEWRTGTRQLAGEHGSAHGRSGLYGYVERAYLQVLAIVMVHRWIIGIMIVATFLAIPITGKKVQKNFLPLEDESRFDVSVRAPEGTAVRQAQLITDRIARGIREIPGVAYTVTTVGSAPGDPSGRGGNQASIFVALTDPTTRALTQQQIMIQARNTVLPRFRNDNLRVIISPVNVFGGGGADSASIQYVLRGSDVTKLADYSQRLLAALRRMPGIVDADTSLVVGLPEYVIRINRARASDLGVSVQDVANAVRLLVGDVQVSTFNEGGEQYEVHLRATDLVRGSITAIQQATVPGAQGRSVRLSDVVEVRESTGPSSIQHLARQRLVTVYSNTNPGVSEAAVIAALDIAKNDLHLEPGYEAALAGRSRELGRAGQSFAIALLLSLTFMYLVLAAQFESWIHPVTILMSLPLTVPFALLSLIVFNQSVNINSALGILVLFGIVKKNSILQVDHMRDLRRRGLERADAVMIGNRDRLRPILMTTVAFVAGMIPLVAGSGAGSGTNRAVGTVVIGGQTLSLVLTLLATPVVYTVFDDISHSRFIRFLVRLISFPFRMLDGLFGSKPAAVELPIDEAPAAQAAPRRAADAE